MARPPFNNRPNWQMLTTLLFLSLHKQTAIDKWDVCFFSPLSLLIGLRGNKTKGFYCPSFLFDVWLVAARDKRDHVTNALDWIYSPGKRGVVGSQLYGKNGSSGNRSLTNGGDLNGEDFCSDASLEDDVVDLGHKVC